MKAMKNDPWTKTVSVSLDMRNEPLPPVLISRSRSTSGFTRPLAVDGRVLATDDDKVVLRALLETIRSAREIVVFSSFLISDKDILHELMEASKRGCRVYGLTSVEAKLDRENRNEFDEKTLKEHRKMLRDFAGHVFLRSSESFHAKCLLTDPHTSPRGFLLTANMTTEALTRNEEIAIRLSSDMCRSLFEHLRYAMWELAKRELAIKGSDIDPVKALGEVQPPHEHKEIVATIPGRCGIHEAALTMIRSAQKRILVASFGWDSGHPVVKALCEQASKGIHTTVLARYRRDMKALIRLRQAGAVVHCFKYLHAKAIIADDQGLVMSANLQRRGLDEGFELGVRLSPADTKELLKILSAWVEAAPWRLDCSAKLGDCLGDVIFLDRAQASSDVVSIKPRETRTLEDVVAQSADRLENAQLPESALREKVREKGPIFAHEVVCTYTIRPPRLPRKAKPEQSMARQEGTDGVALPAVYHLQNKQRVVAIESPDQLPAARKVAKSRGIDRIVVRVRRQ